MSCLHLAYKKFIEETYQASSMWDKSDPLCK